MPAPNSPPVDLMSSLRTARRSLVVSFLSAALLVPAACQREAGRRPAGTAAARAIASPGDVTRDWNPQAVAAVGGVDAAALRSAIVRRLEQGRPDGLSEDHWNHARSLYKYYDQSPLWIDDDGLVTARVAALARALTTADEHDALNLSEYPLAAVASAVETVKRRGAEATADELARADVLLTASYAALGEDLVSGQVNPASLEQDWHIDPRDASIDSVLARGLVTDALDSSLADLRPQDPGYQGLEKELARYRQLASQGGWGTVPDGRKLRPGERDTPARLAALRARLRTEGYDAGTIGGADVPSDTMPASDVYDRPLAGAVAQFQAAHAIVVDSILGRGTVEALNKPASYRVAQIAANMERYRWMPRSLGARYVYVNVPAFRLQAIDSGRPTLEMRVVVGENYQDKTTPVFADSMQFIVFRPYWNITDDIAASETWPKIRSDPSYMDENDLETFKDGGETRLRQRPGDKNSLGLVKFLFPNDYNIYLHDTPSKSLFAKDVRAFSHGCIRVEKPAELASWALGWPVEQVEEAMQKGRDNRQVNLPAKIPVYITYFTAFIEDGRLKFGNDLYDRDDALVAASAAAAEPNPVVAQAVASLRDLVQ